MEPTNGELMADYVMQAKAEGISRAQVAETIEKAFEASETAGRQVLIDALESLDN